MEILNRLRFRLALLGLIAAACGSPSIGDGTVRCGSGDLCPPGMACASDGFCYRDPLILDGGTDARPATCGNGMLEAGETCDPPGSCPTVCEDDSNDCTTTVMSGTAATCDVACANQPIETCADGDACCPAACNSTNDTECSISCGNGTLETGETCDPPSSCPTTCADGNDCTTDTMTGSADNCNVACGHTSITTCMNGDGCCPGGCTAVVDDDCSAFCGNGALEPGETCDPPASCPTMCNDGNSCTNDSLTGSAVNCNVSCSTTSIVSCVNGDLCCPSGCNSSTDNDCSVSCGNGLLEMGETCDPPSSCPTSCSDGNSCTIDTTTGNSVNCNVSCGHTSITSCANGDGCCPGGCTNVVDNDCSALCGNGAVEAGETCDPPGTCPTTCSDGNSCTIDTMTGSSANCNVACSYTGITTCVNGDGCCPTGCNSISDNNCSATCGNGTLEVGETCDPPGTCPTTCSDGNSCTIDTTTGSAATCNVSCGHSTITSCTNGDGCCPTGCNSANDNNCSTSCGNSLLEAGETCDPPGTCPTSCSDGNNCTIDTLTGSAANCNVACSYSPISSCTNGDGCCPSGCNSTNDSNCSASCGNGVLESGETCDPPMSCPTFCSDGNSCTIDSMTGNSANCNVACTFTPITTCANSDMCCPAGCTSANDNNCSASCGNGTIEAGETCDPPTSCPMMCFDANSCTIDTMTGSPSTCNASCSFTAITACEDADMCCPAGCTVATDDDCSATCGNGIIEMGETCDPQMSCPMFCNDGNSCTYDTLTGSPMTCNSVCSFSAITSCTSGDGCCPAGCNNVSDADCPGGLCSPVPMCGDGCCAGGTECASCPMDCPVCV